MHYQYEISDIDYFQANKKPVDHLWRSRDITCDETTEIKRNTKTIELRNYKIDLKCDPYNLIIMRLSLKSNYNNRIILA